MSNQPAAKPFNPRHIGQVVREAVKQTGPSDGSARWIWSVEEKIDQLAANERVAINAISYFNGKYYQHVTSNHSAEN